MTARQRRERMRSRLSAVKLRCAIEQGGQTAVGPQAIDKCRKKASSSEH